ncbi:ERCC4 domain-containing protein [Agriterribacter sp.]|uniref:ERCC4 domain-containing protein n=1 Tax=Agriterribacter sp. TaxID=2821509 RepID=UPI002C22F9B5|nr:ERCC4 domain-containing protein [Agriterribacter sp.]HTN09331.1 ERCC4 domain-containing protein [Agriterribacter sp.]
MPISIQADYRENPSGIPELLAGNTGVLLLVSSLPAGDYIINGTIGVERKSAEDFVQSIIANRLFDQIARLKRSVPRPLLIVEGNPYNTAHKIEDCAIRGALLSVLISWQVPVIFSKSRENTAALLLMAARQDHTASLQIAAPKNYRSKRLVRRQLFFLQGIPGVGPLLAARLLKKFGTLKAVINATEEELKQVEGIGGNNAKKISGFVSAQFPGNTG